MKVEILLNNTHDKYVLGTELICKYFMYEPDDKRLHSKGIIVADIEDSQLREKSITLTPNLAELG